MRFDRRYWNKDLEEHENLRWSHAEIENIVSVSRFSDGTWDTWKDERLVENHDTREEAISRAEELMEELSEDKKSGLGQT